MRYLLALALLLSAAAHSAPVANLVLACPDESAIGQAFDVCRGYAYQVPTNQLIVATRSSGSAFWRRASDLSGADTVLVCTIPVEPGAYSSCRDAAGIRRTAFVPKDSVIMGGGNSVIVSKTGGDYTDPVTAAKNAFAGDTWCVAPQWPDQPCVMAIGDGVYILRETLSVAEGLAVSGNGKGDTMLVADNGVETAVSSFGNVRLTDLTIVNGQPGGSRATGLGAGTFDRFGGLAQLHDVAIHVSGAAQNVALVKFQSLEILDSEITAVGQDTTGIQGFTEMGSGPNLTLERSHVSAEMAIFEEWAGSGATMRLVDSHVSGAVFFEPEHSLLEIIRSAIIGNVTAKNDWVRVVIRDSSIQGDLNPGFGDGHEMTVFNTSVEGVVGVSMPATFDGLRLHGELVVLGASANVLRSYISSSGTGAALSLRRYDSHVQLEQTFVQGAQALAVEDSGQLESSSSVLAGPISASGTAALSCTDTYGADYELLNASCQPQSL